MYLGIFLADFAVFRVFLGISRDFAGPQPREISEALLIIMFTIIIINFLCLLGLGEKGN